MTGAERRWPPEWTLAGAEHLLAGLAVPAVLVGPDGMPVRANIAAEIFLNASQQALAERGWAAAFGSNSAVEGTGAPRA